MTALFSPGNSASEGTEARTFFLDSPLFVSAAESSADKASESSDSDFVVFVPDEVAVSAGDVVPAGGVGVVPEVFVLVSPKGVPVEFAALVAEPGEPAGIVADGAFPDSAVGDCTPLTGLCAGALT